MTKSLNIVSFNARGLRNIRKRRTVFRHMHVKYPHHLILIQECHSTLVSEKQWRAEWGGHVYFAHGSELARGICALVPRNFPGDVTWIHSDQQGRIITLILSINNMNLYLVGVYAPTQSNAREQADFYHELNQYIQTLDAGHPIILGGDMNVHLSEEDTCNVRYNESEAVLNIRELMEEHNLRDIWRERNPTAAKFTWRQHHPLRQSRIDYFFVSGVLADSHNVASIEINPGVRSDHSILSFSVDLLGSKRGPGLWKCNLSLLDNPVTVRLIRDEILKARNKQSRYQDIQDYGLLLETLLGSIRAICMWKGGEAAREKRRAEQQLEVAVKFLENNLVEGENRNTLSEYVRLKGQLDELKTKAAVHAMNRSRAKWIEEGERPSKYFLNLEKRRNAERTTSMLENGTGTGDANILRFCKQYYENLHASKDIPADRIEA